jgi:succinate dehydrogenase / fumarate reductase cytochrome b subunit
VLVRGLVDLSGWRGAGAGLWAWLVQRVAAVLLLLAVGLHLRNPFVRYVQAVLLALVLLHGLLGVRSILLDMGLPVRFHRVLLAAALGVAAIAFLLVWWWRWY